MSNYILAAQFILAVLIGNRGVVPLVNFIKRELKTTSTQTKIVLWSVIVLYVVLTGIAGKAISPETATTEQLILFATAVFTASQAEYNRLKRQIIITEVDEEE